MFTPVASVVAGTKGTATWGNSVDTAIDEPQTALLTIRHRRNRAGITVPTGIFNLFGTLATGVVDENVGGITFTTDATNGYFTVPVAASYEITLSVDPTTLFGVTSTLNITAGGVAYQCPIAGGSVAAPATLVKYLDAAATVTFSVTNNSGGSLTATVVVEIARVTPTTP